MELCEASLEQYIQTEFNASAPDMVPPSIYRPARRPGDLDRLERIAKWRGIVSIMLDILHGLKFIHAYDEVHRDLKPTNSIVKPVSLLTSQFCSPKLMAVGKSPISGLRRQAHLQASVAAQVEERTVTMLQRYFGNPPDTVVRWTSGDSDAFFSKLLLELKLSRLIGTSWNTPEVADGCESPTWIITSLTRFSFARR
jgi:serine/threonine protein kinase